MILAHEEILNGSVREIFSSKTHGVSPAFKKPLMH